MRHPYVAAGRLAFGQQHGHDLARRAVAEKLTQGLLVPGDAMLVDQGDEIVLGAARQRRFAEMRIARQERLGAAQEVGEVAASAARDQDLLADLVRSEEHTSELQSRQYLVCRLLLEKKKKK